MRVRRLLVVLAALVAVVSGAVVSAQGRGGFGRGTAFTPTPGAKDLKSVLYNWTWHMGMLRSGNESELVKTLEYQAEGGTIQVNGQPCRSFQASSLASGARDTMAKLVSHLSSIDRSPSVLT